MEILKNPYKIDRTHPFYSMDNTEADFASESCWWEGAKELWRVLNEPCTEHPLPIWEDADPIIYYESKNHLYHNHHYDCPQCRKEITKVLEEK